MREGYTNVSVGHEVRTAIVQFQLQAQGALGTRLKQGDAVMVALHIASQCESEELRAAAIALGLIPPAESNGETQ